MCFSCRAVNEARTRDPQLGKLVLYQLSYYRILPFGADTGTRTRDLFITNELLYQLSHIGVDFFNGAKVILFIDYKESRPMQTLNFNLFFQIGDVKDTVNRKRLIMKQNKHPNNPMHL